MVALDKDFRVVSSGQLIAEGAGLSLRNLTVAPSATFSSAGAIQANALSVSGSLVLSGSQPLSAQTLLAAPGAVFVWEKFFKQKRI